MTKGAKPESRVYDRFFGLRAIQARTRVTARVAPAEGTPSPGGIGLPRPVPLEHLPPSLRSAASNRPHFPGSVDVDPEGLLLHPRALYAQAMSCIRVSTCTEQLT